MPAFELALDRETINKVVFNGLHKVDNQWVPPASPYHMDRFPTPKRDVARRARWSRRRAWPPDRVDFMVPNNPEAAPVAEVMQRWAAEAGFDLKIRVTEFATSLKRGGEGQLQPVLPRLERPHRSRTATSSPSPPARPAELRQVLRPEGRRLLTQARHRPTTFSVRKTLYEQAAARSARGGVIYCTTHAAVRARPEARWLQVMPDGLIRVTEPSS